MNVEGLSYSHVEDGKTKWNRFSVKVLIPAKNSPTPNYDQRQHFLVIVSWEDCMASQNKPTFW